MADQGTGVDKKDGVPAAPTSFTAPQLSLPKGGGALRGIGETFSADLATGTGHLQVPIRLSPGHAGSGPQLSLAYDSGNGNGPFGMGWRLTTSSITRRTDKGLPRYDNLPIERDTRETDIFVLSGSDDLVPELVEDDGAWRVSEPPRPHGYAVQAYRPRIEGLFARIERWTRLADGDTHWRTITRDNVLSLYGLDANSRIADPDDPRRVFTWLIARTYDDRGDAIVYDYSPENDLGIELHRPSERHRSRAANRYLRRVRWGNRIPQMLDPTRPSFRPCHLDAPDPDAIDWLFSALLDYGEERYQPLPPDHEGRPLARATLDAPHAWPGRPDPFSSYRSGFEVRTHRLCRHVLMFHHMPEALGTRDYLVGSTSFTYRERLEGSLLVRIEQCGHVRQPDGHYLTRALPPLDLGYTASPLEDGSVRHFAACDMDPAGLADLPGGVDGAAFRWLDLNGEGIAGVLAEQGGGWFYKPNRGEGRLGPSSTVPWRPSLAGAPSSARHLMDVDGDGLVDLLDLSPTSSGYHGRDIFADWLPFRTFRDMPMLDWSDPDLRFIDLTGDGIADVLITRDAAFDWRPSFGPAGFGAAHRVHVPTEEEETSPRLLLAEATETIFLADMTGDGLTDLVRVRNGEVCFWPNRGYGRFGAKVVMERAPWFDTRDLFNPRRLRLADVDGTGNTDLIYLGANGATVYLNQSGNGWSTARQIGGWPANDSVAATDVIDLLGRGTACLVWSSPLPRDAGRQLRYIDLMCGRKPHLLDRIDANMGAVKRIEYATSTEFYLADKAAGAPWITRLPIPVHVVRRVETWDAVSRNRIVSSYSYHHGYYDGVEREFRGFGRVDQLDTEDIASLTPAPEPADNWDAASSVPPVLTKTWFHTGVFPAGELVSRHLAHEYFNDRPPEGGPDWSDRRAQVPLLPDTILPPHLSGEEAREACRALKGSMLRQEIYGLDDTPTSATPYSVTESNFAILTVQPRGDNRYASFFTHPRESIAVHYERDAADPRIGHDLTLAVDEYGDVLRSASIGYARRKPEYDEQGAALATLTERRFTSAVLLPDAHRTPELAEEAAYQLTAPTIVGAAPLSFAAVEDLSARAAAISYQAAPTPGRTEKRLIAQSRTVYRTNDLRSLLPDGALEALALPGETFTLALTDELLALFAEKAPAEALARILTARDGGYRDLDGDGRYWIPSGRIFFSQEADAPANDELAVALRHFFEPHRYRDPFGHDTVVGYDQYDLAPVVTRDAVGNVTHAELDYRVLAVRRMTDPNGNRSEARYDALGLLAGTAVAGKAEGPVEGDSFAEFAPDLTPAEITAYFEARDPRERAHAALGTATTRIIYDFTRLPVCAASIARETHVADLAPGQVSRLQLRFVYSDGFGREAQTRAQAEPGPLDLARPEAGHADPRWVATGAKIYNNKGKPVRQYEPFFSAAPQFGIERWGVSNVLFYDPLERVVATLHPNKTYEKVVFDPWRQVSYDANDTVMFDPGEDPDVGEFLRRLPPADYWPTWYAQRIDGALGPHEKVVAEKAAVCANTPTLIHFDSLGRHFLTIADNGRDDDGRERLYATRTVLDIEGNQRAVIDALDRVVMRYEYDMLGTRIRQQSMEAGERWMLNDVARKPLRSWNSRGFAFRMEYDALHRPLRSFVRGGEPADPESQFFEHEVLFERTIYGDSAQTDLSEPQQCERNLRGKPFKHFDGAGVVATEHYDFKGNLLTSTRRFADDFRKTPDWSSEVTIEATIFHSASAYDALNRVAAVTAPDGSIYRPTFNDASLLLAVDVALRGAGREGKPFWTPFVSFINYDAKGQRTVIRYANGTTTSYEYDPETFRLTRLKTTRKARESGVAAEIFKMPGTVQNLRYTYDPVGNITRIEDAALKTVFHANHRVEPVNEYTYDPLYRLLEATGRENAGQSAFSFAPKDGDYRDFPFVGAARQNDLQALRHYVERYNYDPVGNFQTMSHRAEGGNWERVYCYDEASLIEPGKVSNRLSRTSIEEETSALVERYSHDAHGNMTRMPHLPRMRWDFHDQLHATTRQVLNEGTPEETWYVYNSSGERARKVTTRRDGGRKNERLYLGGFELFRAFEYSGAVALERETLHVMDDKHRIALVETLTVDDGKAILIPNPTKRYQLANHLGSASLELAADCELISYEEYSPFGGSTFQAGRTTAEVSSKRYRFTEKERDEENGFTYHGARYYAPWLGRWTACDPSGIKGGLNLFAYVEGHPTIATDPTGRILFVFIALVVIISALTVVSEAGAPTNKEEAAAVKPAITPTEAAARTAAIGVGAAAGAGVLQGAPAVLQGMAQGLVGGTAQGVLEQGIQDVKKGEVSSPKEYAKTAIQSGASGVVAGGAVAAGGQLFRLGARLITKGASAIKARPISGDAPTPKTHLDAPPAEKPSETAPAEKTPDQGSPAEKKDALATVPKFASRKLEIEHGAKHGAGVIVKNPAKPVPKEGGADVPEGRTVSTYSKIARFFFSGHPEGVEDAWVKGQLYRFDPRTGFFGILSKAGVVRTLFRPDKGREYFLKAVKEALTKK